MIAISEEISKGLTVDTTESRQILEGHQFCNVQSCSIYSSVVFPAKHWTQKGGAIVKLYSPNAAAHNHRPEGFSSPPCSAAAASLTELVSNAAAQKRKGMWTCRTNIMSLESLFTLLVCTTHSLHCSKKRRTTNLLQLLVQ